MTNLIMWIAAGLAAVLLAVQEAINARKIKKISRQLEHLEKENDPPFEDL